MADFTVGIDKVDYTKIFYTVPLYGSALYRDANGNKTGAVFDKEGWSKYTNHRNEMKTPVLAAIAREDFIGLDFDTDELFRLATSLDLDCKYIAKSDLKGGHMLYRWDEETVDFFPKKKILGKLDIQMGNSLIYLATEANTTKQLLTEPLMALESLSYMPMVMKFFLKSLLLEDIKKPAVASFSNGEAGTLGYILDEIKETSPYDEAIVAAITPLRYKQYKHPDEVPDGGGTMYLQAIRTKLAMDDSVSEEVFTTTMLWINNLWTDPLPKDRILRDCSYQINNAVIASTGDRAWRYNPEWNAVGLVARDARNNALEYLYVPSSGECIEFNKTTNEHIIFNGVDVAKRSLLSRTKRTIGVTDMLRLARPVQLINSPKEQENLILRESPSLDDFNMFKSSAGVRILRNPALIGDNYEYPDFTIRFLKNLIPNTKRLKWFLGFLKRKHTTYDYSPVYILVDGVGGAGKGILVNTILAYFSGMARIQEVDLDKLANNFNAWKVTTDYAVVDESIEGMTKSEMKQLVAELKKLTGTSFISVSFKGKDIKGEDNRPHYITPIIISNVSRKLITDATKNDRRLVRIFCPNTLASLSGGKDALWYSKIVAELPNFAYYLATEVESLSDEEYITNESQKDEDYYNYAKETLDPSVLLLEAIEDRNLESFIEILQEHFGVTDALLDRLFHPDIQKGAAGCLVYVTPLVKSRLNPNLLTLIETVHNRIEASSTTVKDFTSKVNKSSKYENTETSMGIAKLNVLRFIGEYSPREHITAISGEDIDF